MSTETMVQTDILDTKQLLRVLTAVKKGDFSVRMPVEYTGIAGKIADTLNDIIEINGKITDEFKRLGEVVGKEGRIAQRASVGALEGAWADKINAVNTLIADLVQPTAETARVIRAVASGDLSQTSALEIEGRPLKGEFFQTAKIVNTMVDQLNSFAAEVTRVAREVGTEGKLGGQAAVKGLSGTWKDLTDNVNLMASNLTAQVRNIAEVTTAVANGNLSEKITVDVRGEILDLKNTINTMVDQLNSFASEVTRVAREVGTEGKLGGQAKVKGIGGTWKDLTDNVNSMASNLTAQVRNIADVTTAVANGDLSRKITVDVRGEILDLKDTINTMVDQLNSFASEVTRVAREVGTEGKLGGQAEVKGIGGTWKDLTDNVNSMASNLTAQVRNIADVTTAVANGNLSKKITVDVRGEILDLKNTINTMVDQLNSFAAEVTRVAREVGTEGKLGGQAEVKGIGGTWKDLTDNVNSMASNLTAQVRNIADVTTAVANGDLSRKITVDVRGEILDLKNTINTMVDQLNSFASEVTRVAREVGTEGKLGGQAEVKGVGGTWKDLTDNVNSMASNLTAQVRNIAGVVTAVANGDLERKLALEAKGEIAALADTINEMIDTLATFADQVTTVAREVGIEGKLGGQASVPSAAGTWRHLTDNVNQLAANLTTQVRAIGEVATAVTKGDLTRSITVETQGELAELKDNINQMIANLRETTQKNTEQDWLKTNLAKFSRTLQGQRNLETVSRQTLSELAPLVSAQHGLFYIMDTREDAPVLKLLSSYAHRERKTLSNQFHLGEGLVGQCALEKEPIQLTDVPGDYVKISSGLGEAQPLNVVVLPVLFEGQVTAVIELASFNRFSEIHLTFLEQLTESIGVVLNTIAATMRTEALLSQSQSLAEELQNQQLELTETNRRLEQQARSLQASEDLLRSQQETLRQTNEELEQKASLLATQNREVEEKNRQIEHAKRELEEKAAQLALTSKYKSEFLANMSHELRTPLNSMLILSRLLAENGEGNLTAKQVEFAQTVYVSGADLLALINDILDLTKIEAGKVAVDIHEVVLTNLLSDLERAFRQMADEKGLAFSVELAQEAPRAIYTDGQRLKQVLKNLLSNSVKFTEKGSVALQVSPAVTAGLSFESEALKQAGAVLVFSVTDTGIGIPSEKQRIIFEAFQQLDGTTSRKYGGAGLGLSISREIARLLGGEIRVTSEPEQGSTFTLYLPQTVLPPALVTHKADSPEPAVASSNRTPTIAVSASEEPLFTLSEIQDDRNNLQITDRVLLIIEDDAYSAQIEMDVAHEKDFKVLTADNGEDGLAIAREFKPHAVILDLKLPGMDGWTVLDRLKHDPDTRHIPVYIVSVVSDRPRGIQQGAVAQLTKPVTREALAETVEAIHRFTEGTARRLLLIEDNSIECRSIVDLLGDEDIQIITAGTGAEALAALENRDFDCLILDLGLPDMTGFDLIARLNERQKKNLCPIIVYTAKDLTPEEQAQLQKVAVAIIIKDMGSLERLLDLTTLYLHRVEANLSEPRRSLLAQIRKNSSALMGKKVLIIDDDIRNIFAMTGVLEHHRVQVTYAENGEEGVRRLQETPDLDMVLLDIMMPGIDGYEVLRLIREMDQFRSLPIIAVTAKAMKGDREKCLEAGASDYVTKPVDIEHLLSLMRVWLYRQPEV